MAFASTVVLPPVLRDVLYTPQGDGGGMSAGEVRAACARRGAEGGALLSIFYFLPRGS
jgi:hypothetical protein